MFDLFGILELNWIIISFCMNGVQIYPNNVTKNKYFFYASTTYIDSSMYTLSRKFFFFQFLCKHHDKKHWKRDDRILFSVNV